MTIVHVGCSGFQKSHQEYYKYFGLVEIQQTFYKPPKLETALRWRSEAPPGFIFTMKAWQVITHEPYLLTYRRSGLNIPREQWREYGSFRDTAVVLGAWDLSRRLAQAMQAGVVLFQCPPQFTPTKEHIENLQRFFTNIERGHFLLAWEPRGKWPAEVVTKLCRELDLLHAVDPFLTPSLHGVVGYYRMHGGPDYKYRFQDPDLDRLLAVCQEKPENYCLFNNQTMWEDGLRYQTMCLKAGMKLALPAAEYVSKRENT